MMASFYIQSPYVDNDSKFNIKAKNALPDNNTVQAPELPDLKSIYENSATAGNNTAVNDSSSVTSAAEAYNAAIAKISGQASDGKSSVDSSAASVSDGTPSSKASYINDLYDASQKSALSALESSYNQSLSSLDATAAKIPQQYYTAKNEAAAQNAQSNQAFNEYAAASGLNSGAGGQAALASSNQLQSNLSSLSQAQATALADIETRRAELTTQYQSAVAQAIADNDLEKANALLSEAQRVEAAYTSYYEFMKNYGLQEEQFNYTKEQNQTATDTEAAATAKAEAKSRIDSYLSAGGSVSALDPSLIAASGYTDAELAAYETYHANQNTPTAKSSGVSDGAAGTTSLFQALQANGGSERTYLINKGYSTSEIESILSEYNDWLASQGGSSRFYAATGSPRYSDSGTLFTDDEFNGFIQSVGMNRSKNGQQTTIEDAYKEGKITEAQARALMDQFGIEY